MLPVVGSRIASGHGNWSRSVASYAYQWQRCTDAGGGGAADIGGATSDTYTVGAEDTGSFLRCAVTATFAGGGSGTLPSKATAQVGGGSEFPLSVHASGRYLVRANGEPFYMVACSPQAAIVNLVPTDETNPPDAGTFFAARQAQGFNTCWINLLCSGYTGGRGNGSTYDGIVPFTGGGYYFSNPNEPYFARVDAIVQIATDHGFLVVLDPVEFRDFGDAAIVNGTSVCNTYGQYLGERYSAFDNVAWMHGNDYTSNYWSTYDAYLTKVSEGIRTAAPNMLQTIELDQDDSSLDNASWVSLIDYNCAYPYHTNPFYHELWDDYTRSPHLPNVMVESYYEGEGANARDIRRQAYWTLCCGVTGYYYGNAYEWTIPTGWQNHLTSPDALGADHMRHYADFIADIAWHTLVPDSSHTLLTANYGTDDGGDNYCLAAKSADGTLGLVFITFATNVTTNLNQMAGAVTAQWYDPTNGTYSSAGSGLTGSHQFTHPGNNSAGAPDWALLLEA